MDLPGVGSRIIACSDWKEIWKSFGAVSYAHAQKLARMESLKVDALFAIAAGEQLPSVPLPSLTDRDVLFIAQQYLHNLEADAEPIPFDKLARMERLETAQEEAFSLAQTNVEDAGLQHLATLAARDLGRPQLSSSDLLRVTDAVQRALSEHYAREEDRAGLHRERRYDQAFLEIDAKTAPLRPLTVERAIELYKADPEKSNVAHRTRGAYEFRYRLLGELLGPSRAIAGISRADVREVREILMKLPANAAKRFPGRGLREIADIASREGVAPMSPKSIALYIEALSALFNWLVREEMVDRNPAVALKGPTVQEQSDRRPFNAEELSKFFRAAAFSGANGKGWMYWTPRLALFSGARFAELLALNASDITTVDGIHCLSIVPNEIRDLKTRGSKRLVPIHPAVIDAGFLKYVSEISGDGLLFPDAAGPADMLMARNKQMGREIRALFDDRTLVFHSFRHGFKDAAGRARISREVISLPGGWSAGQGRTSMDDYGRDNLVPILFEELSRITFPGLEV